jgi:hypothetical protein
LIEVTIPSNPTLAAEGFVNDLAKVDHERPYHFPPEGRDIVDRKVFAQHAGFGGRCNGVTLVAPKQEQGGRIATSNTRCGENENDVTHNVEERF